MCTVNEFIAEQPINMEHHAHEFVTALTNPEQKVEVQWQDGVGYPPTGRDVKSPTRCCQAKNLHRALLDSVVSGE
jgi:hypothetical protein